MHGQLLEVGKGAVALGTVSATKVAAKREHRVRELLQCNLDSTRRRHRRGQEARFELVRVGHEKLLAVLGEERDEVQLLVVKLAVFEQTSQRVDLIQGLDIGFHLQ